MLSITSAQLVMVVVLNVLKIKLQTVLNVLTIKDLTLVLVKIVPLMIVSNVTLLLPPVMNVLLVNGKMEMIVSIVIPMEPMITVVVLLVSPNSIVLPGH